MLTEAQKIEHIVLNVPNMAMFSYKMYFGRPTLDEGNPDLVPQLRAHAKQYMESGFPDIDVLYDDVEGNGELVDPLPNAS